MGLSKPERALITSRIIKLATIGSLSAEEISTQLGLPVSRIRAILNKNYDRIIQFNDALDTALTKEELAHFRESRSILFAHLEKAAYRLVDLLDSRDPRVVLDTFDRLGRATGIDLAPSETSTQKTTTAPSFNIDKILVALSAPPPMAPLPTGLPPEHPLSLKHQTAKLMAPDASSNPPAHQAHSAPVDGSGAPNSSSPADPGRPSLEVLPPRRGSEEDAASRARLVPILDGP